TETDFENVLSVKLDGLLTLLQCVNLDQLQHLLLFSSVAGFYGNLGQTDYSMANEILSKAAHLFKQNHPQTQVSAINWGAWDAGMVSPELKKKFEAAGVTLVNSAGGAAMLINELNTAYADQAQVIIGGTLPMAISHLHPKLQTWRIHRQLKAADNPFLQHHVIQGKAVLPVVNAVGWLAQSCSRLYPDFRIFEVRNAKLFKGLIFDGQEKENYIAELKEIEKDDQQIVFEACILSEGAKLPTFHYKAQVVLKHRSALPSAPRFTPQLSGNYTAIEGSVLYENGALFHGQYFRGIQRVLDWNEEQIVLACQAPEVPQTAQGQFPVEEVNTFFSDIQYQGMVIWVQRYNEGAKSLPLQTDSAIIYATIPFGKELFVHVKVVESSDFKMVADCTVYDAEGKVYMFTQNAAVTVSKTLNW
ncbi:MAG: KR domain-containing protein, partial [Bacteroidota bacterium]